MSAAIGPGDWVECIDNRGRQEVAIGSVWIVEAVGMVGTNERLVLVGLISPDGLRKVLAECFRPIYRPKSKIIQELLQPIPEDA